MNHELKAVDFFCGAGGVTCGFRQAGIRVLGGIDNDSSCKDTYEKNNRGSKFLDSDIAELSFEKLSEEFQIRKNDDDLIFIGCSPCQYYTVINTSKKRSKKTRLLLEEFQKFVDHFRPGQLFIENVPGLESKNDSPLTHFKEFIESIGYTIDDKVINASGYNVPQNRKRYVLIASRISVNISIPKPRKNKSANVKSAIGKFPEIPCGNDDPVNQHITSNLTRTNIRRLELTPENGGTRNSWSNITDLQLSCYNGKDDIFPDVYGRMFWDKPSPTITTKFNSISNGRFGHPKQNRGISLREGATLQSCPDNYYFYSERITTIARMIGNAVPPKMAKKIGNALIENRINASI